ncbi:hypothetical protein [Streptomyces sp. NPDC051546]|uniref:hypothetical protein n=1 Tax=Streptomyces sp. NPDC051546 TaxID=3365655 RepID=UPI0037B19694
MPLHTTAIGKSILAHLPGAARSAESVSPRSRSWSPAPRSRPTHPPCSPPPMHGRRCRRPGWAADQALPAPAAPVSSSRAVRRCRWPGSRTDSARARAPASTAAASGARSRASRARAHSRRE